MRPGQPGACGQRGNPAARSLPRPLPWVVEAGERKFPELAEQATIPILVDLRAPWYGPCRIVGPALEQVTRNLAGRPKLVKVNVDENPRITQRFSAQAIPTLLVLNRAAVVGRRAGAAPAPASRDRVETVIAAATSTGPPRPSGSAA